MSENESIENILEKVTHLLRQKEREREELDYYFPPSLLKDVPSRTTNHTIVVGEVGFAKLESGS